MDEWTFNLRQKFAKFDLPVAVGTCLREKVLTIK